MKELPIKKISMKKWLVEKQRLPWRKTRASSILEITTAMVLVSMIFVSSAMIYLNLTASGKSKRQVQISHLLNRLAQENIAEGIFLDQQYRYETFTVYQQVVLYKKQTDLFWFSLEALGNDGKVIATHNQLVYEPNR